MDSVFKEIESIKEVDKEIVENVKRKIIELKEERDRPVNVKPQITCAGVYNAGKSTLLNALIGKKVFEIGDIPTTSAIDKVETDNIVYVDTPGLNANDIDNEMANKAYKNADIVIFVSNIQNGGLNSAEANYIKKISDIMGGIEIFKNSVIFVLSNMHQVEENNIDRVVEQHKKNIESILNITLEKIYVYDAATYSLGVKQNENTLIEKSGVLELKRRIEEISVDKKDKLSEISKKRLKNKENETQKVFDEMIFPVIEKLKALDKDVNEAVDSAEKLKNIEQEWKKKIAEFKENNLSVPENTPVTGSVYLGTLSSIHDRKSESRAKSDARSKVSNIYDKRESKVRSVVRDLQCAFMKYLEYEMKDDNYYTKRNRDATVLILEYAKKLREYNITIQSSLLTEIQIGPKDTKNIISNLAYDLSDDVVQYGQYYTVDYYVGLLDIDECEDFSRKGLFGGTRYNYSIWNMYAAVDEMEKDLNQSLSSNISRKWSSIKNILNDYNKKLNKELGTRIETINKEVEKVIQNSKDLKNAEVKRNEIIKSVELFSGFVKIPEEIDKFKRKEKDYAYKG